MLTCDLIVIGAGIIGLSTAYVAQLQQPGIRVVIVEKEAAPAWHQTGHNSGVIHSGIYYAPDSLKARFCKQGNRDIKAFCDEHSLSYASCGKLLVATNKTEFEQMEVLASRAHQNGIEAHSLNRQELHECEPNITGLSALLVPSTAIVNYHTLCQQLVKLINKNGGKIFFNTAVKGLTETSAGITAVTSTLNISAHKLISCAGVMSDRLVKLLGHQPDFQIIPFRGDYFTLPQEKSQLINHLIYPVPDPKLPFLGIHLTKMIEGRVTIGPSAVVSFAREGYGRFAFNGKDTIEMLRFPGFHRLINNNKRAALHEFKQGFCKKSYLQQVKKYCPKITASDLIPYSSGIRAQAVGNDGTMIDDFLFHQTKNTLMVCNAPSPAATSCFPIARHIIGSLMD